MKGRSVLYSRQKRALKKLVTLPLKGTSDYPAICPVITETSASSGCTPNAAKA
jgi:hypothetical protein